ncbi:hypothetical protein HYPSUDRAFT_208797 [Hypholoma sublateritium FD-334 SS-4]|uniref:Uncharacterized protein n=1 Tax=Hypholoma sublateritium (strain FD-334 SS-4) TaxID=945553 RepID=A0A0D2KI96_HYPSF|nr:hypothetical protein HYPSUDRAFT_208797 [Hypholoma sublateritium FD-334 SS-4]
MHEKFDDIYNSLKLYYTFNHFCRRISAECIENSEVRQRVRPMIALAIHTYQDILREALQEPNENADLHPTDEHPKDHWTIRMYDANNSHSMSLHICEADLTTTATIVRSQAPRMFVHAYPSSIEEGLQTVVTLCFCHGISPLLCGGWSSVDE